MHTTVMMMMKMMMTEWLGAGVNGVVQQVRSAVHPDYFALKMRYITAVNMNMYCSVFID